MGGGGGGSKMFIKAWSSYECMHGCCGTHVFDDNIQSIHSIDTGATRNVQLENI